MASPTDIERLYARQARIYDWTRWPLLRGRRRLVAALDLRRGERVLDLGCGTGALLARAARAIGPGGRAVGVDVSGAMLARARQRLGHLPQVELHQLEIAPDTLPPGPFDAVLLGYVLTLVDDPAPVLDAARGALVAGGRLAVVDFLDARRSPVRSGFEWHRVRFDPALRDAVAGGGAVEWSVEGRAGLGTWRWFATVVRDLRRC